MRSSIWITMAAIGLIAGCDNMNADRDLPAGDSTSATADNSPPAADNTGINKRDVEQDTKTPIDQGNNAEDLKVTSEIRKRVLDTENMSVNARNCKIVTENGKTFLRGPVASAAERDAIYKIAVDIAGEGNVTNELEIAP